MKKTKLIKQLNFFIRRKYFLPIGFTSYLFLKNYYSLPGISCPIRTITGVPCPTCFLTRSTCLALKGDLDDSFKTHLYGPFLAIFLIIWSIKAIQKKHIFPFLINKNYILIITITLIIYWIFRLKNGFPIP